MLDPRHLSAPVGALLVCLFTIAACTAGEDSPLHPLGDRGADLAGGADAAGPAADAGAPVDPGSTGPGVADKGGEPASSDLPRDEAAADAPPERCYQPKVSFEAPTMRIVTLGLGASGHPGEGLDVDESADTCAPATPADSCSEGIDNSLAELEPIFRDLLQEDLDTLEIVLLADLPGFNTAGDPFGLRVFEGEGMPSCVDDPQSCSFRVQLHSFDPDCEPNVELTGATMSGKVVELGGLDTTIRLPLPIPDQDPLPRVEVHRVHVRMELELDGDRVTSASAILAGATSKQALLDLVPIVPTTSIPVTKEALIDLLDKAFAPDQDLDGDGEPESVSFSLKMTAEPTSISGLAP